MSTKADSTQAAHSSRGELFAASCLALVVSAIAFGIRGDTLGDFMKQFNATPDKIGWAISGAFWGFTIAIVFSGMVCDWLGMKSLLVFAFILHLVGIAGTVFARSIPMLAVGTLLIGFGNGFVEGAINPLIATLYPDNKTAKLNALHAWWPGGIVIGALLGFAMSHFHASWQMKTGVLFIPTLIYGFMFVGLKLPQTERVQSGVSTRSMFKEILRPLFIIWIFCMLLTASTELGTNQWIGQMMKMSGISSGILLLAWVSFVMLIGRSFAGPVVHKLSPSGLLVGSAAISTVGLFALSLATSAAMSIIAATIFSIGICYFWPTMLGITSERHPKGGALAMGIVGAAGMASAGIAQPVAGWLIRNYDVAGALRHATLLPAILTIIFAVFYIADLKKGGYKAVKLTPEEEAAKEQAEVVAAEYEEA